MVSQSHQYGTIEEIIDTAEETIAAHQSESESDGDPVDVEGDTASTSKKKKKKKSKAARALAALKGDTVPQALVDHVVKEVQAKHGPNAEGADEANIRMALDQLKVMDVLKGKSGLGGKNRKEMGEHKFWATQPVPQLGEGPPPEDGFIEASKPASEVRQNPYPLPKEFEWATVDLEQPAQLKEVYELLSLNYVEDDDASFRFQYTAEFLEWALKPPGWFKDWHIGVRVAANKKLVAFISAVPVKLRVRKNTIDVSEVNFLCVHKKLRSKRLAPVLIKEVTRQCNLKGTFQAIYTAGVVLPTPVSTCRYYHRSLNVQKLVDIKFTYIPRNSTLPRMIRSFRVPSTASMHSRGLREMENKDVPQVTALWEKYMARFSMAPVMTDEEIRHYLLSGRGRGEVQQGRREGQVVWSYVVEDPQTNKITDYFSFYTLPSSIIHHPKHTHLQAAYCFYYATDVALEDGAEENGKLKRRLHELMGDALIVADQAKFDVFNALTLMDNNHFLEDLKFGSGDGLLNYYLYNWRTSPLAGVQETGDTPIGKGVGVVML